MINLFERYNKESEELHTSLIKSGYAYPTIVINYDGFLPDGVVSPYSYFLGENKKTLARYFNQVAVPEFWEIASTGPAAEILDYSKKRANIIYAQPTHRRYVNVVEWLDNNNVIRLVDRYDKFGRKFAATSYSAEGTAAMTNYYDVNNKEIIVENHITGDIILNTEKGIKIFKDQISFLKYFVEVANVDTTNVIYNSLSTPFFATNQFEGEGSNILVWQEEIIDFIPGNMQFILEGNTHTKKIVVPKKDTYDKIMTLVEDKYKDMFIHKGYVYNFERDNSYNNEALVFTNSDQLQNIEQLVVNLPHINFNIGALTEMSSKLNELDKYDNVRLYANATPKEIDYLFNNCSFYFDINHHNEVLGAVERAFLNNMLVMAFANTLHSDRYVAEGNVYAEDDIANFVAKVNTALNDKQYMQNLLVDQLEQANTEEKISYEEYIYEK